MWYFWGVDFHVINWGSFVLVWFKDRIVSFYRKQVKHMLLMVVWMVAESTRSEPSVLPLMRAHPPPCFLHFQGGAFTSELLLAGWNPSYFLFNKENNKDWASLGGAHRHPHRLQEWSTLHFFLFCWQGELRWGCAWSLRSCPGAERAGSRSELLSGGTAAVLIECKFGVIHSEHSGEVYFRETLLLDLRKWEVEEKSGTLVWLELKPQNTSFRGFLIQLLLFGWNRSTSRLSPNPACVQLENADRRGGVCCVYFSKRLRQKKLSLRLESSSDGGDASWRVSPPQTTHPQPPAAFNFPCCWPSSGVRPREVCLDRLGLSARCAPVLHPRLSGFRRGSWPGSAARMEGDVMDKVEATATVCDFDPMSGSIPATKVEITVSCRWIPAVLCARESVWRHPRVWWHFSVRCAQTKRYIEGIHTLFYTNRNKSRCVGARAQSSINTMFELRVNHSFCQNCE